MEELEEPAEYEVYEDARQQRVSNMTIVCETFFFRPNHHAVLLFWSSCGLAPSDRRAAERV